MQVQVRMGQANVLRWVPEIMPLLGEDDPLGTRDLATHELPLDEAPAAYDKFDKRVDGYTKVVLPPAA
jgi:threonine dehydrogenase-like Zn-dependent dehydrogenase